MTLPPDPDNSIITIDTIVFSVFKKLYHQFSFKTVGGFLVVNLTFLDQFGLTMIRIKKKAIFLFTDKIYNIDSNSYGDQTDNESDD